jgi:hypothetical protein
VVKFMGMDSKMARPTAVMAFFLIVLHGFLLYVL